LSVLLLGFTGTMTEHSCYIYENGDLVNVLTVRVYYHKTRVTAKSSG